MDVAKAYAKATGYALSTVGLLAGNSGRLFINIEKGSPITGRRYHKLIKWFSARWPDGVEFPRFIMDGDS